MKTKLITTLSVGILALSLISTTALASSPCQKKTVQRKPGCTGYTAGKTHSRGKSTSSHGGFCGTSSHNHNTKSRSSSWACGTNRPPHCGTTTTTVRGRGRCGGTQWVRGRSGWICGTDSTVDYGGPAYGPTFIPGYQPEDDDDDDDDEEDDSSEMTPGYGGYLVPGGSSYSGGGFFRSHCHHGATFLRGHSCHSHGHVTRTSCGGHSHSSHHGGCSSHSHSSSHSHGSSHGHCASKSSSKRHCR